MVNIENLYKIIYRSNSIEVSSPKVADMKNSGLTLMVIARSLGRTIEEMQLIEYRFLYLIMAIVSKTSCSNLVAHIILMLHTYGKILLRFSCMKFIIIKSGQKFIEVLQVLDIWNLLFKRECRIERQLESG